MRLHFDNSRINVSFSMRIRFVTILIIFITILLTEFSMEHDPLVDEREGSGHVQATLLM